MLKLGKFQVKKMAKSKLKPGQITEIREKIEEGILSQTALAKRYEVTQATISRIANYKAWVA